jgi:hypothetical protein
VSGPEPTAPVAAAGWRYPDDEPGRDRRIDFLRGVVLAVLLIAHFEYFSLFSLLAWERVGLITGAEGFVILSGFVLGMIHRRTLVETGWRVSVGKLLQRAAQLYRVHTFIILSIGLLMLVPFIDASAVTTFVDRAAAKAYPLYPPVGADSLPLWLAKAFTLQMGPHQVQILGLYVVLMALSPFALFLLHHGWTRWLLGLSWVLYFFNVATPSMPTHAQFEYAFPLLTWQLVYVHGMAAGYHRDRLLAFFQGRWGRPVIGLAVVVFLASLFLAQNATNPFLPAWAHLSVVPPETFNTWYGLYFQKNTLGLGRLLNYAAALVVAYGLLTIAWKPLDRAFGWYFVPIGQATLYVFIVHVYLVLVVTQVAKMGLAPVHILAHTALHAALLAIVWLMVRFKVLYRWIPR